MESGIVLLNEREMGGRYACEIEDTSFYSKTSSNEAAVVSSSFAVSRPDVGGGEDSTLDQGWRTERKDFFNEC